MLQFQQDGQYEHRLSFLSLVELDIFQLPRRKGMNNQLLPIYMLLIQKDSHHSIRQEAPTVFSLKSLCNIEQSHANSAGKV